MSFAHWLTMAAMASLPLAAAAQQKHQQTDPTDANTAVPASTYDSAFSNYRAAMDEQEPPDRTWRAANSEVEKLGGHAGHMKGEAAASTDHHAHHQSKGTHQ